MARPLLTTCFPDVSYQNPRSDQCDGELPQLAVRVAAEGPLSLPQEPLDAAEKPQEARVDHRRGERPFVYPIALLGGPVSDEARVLVQHLVDHVVLPATGASRPTSIAKIEQAVGALMADLFDLQKGRGRGGQAPQGAHGLSPRDFDADRLGFARDIFLKSSAPLVAAGIISQVKGAPRWQPAFGKAVNIGGTATTFWLTNSGVTLAEAFGIGVGDWASHWCRTDGTHRPAQQSVPRLLLRTASVRKRGRRIDPQDYPFDPTSPVPFAILQAVERLNDYLHRQRIGGMAFAGLRRIFSNGDQSDFQWNKGGRYYSLPGGHRYEGWGAEMRHRAITLNDEAVAEVDFRASHLTLLHALRREPLDQSIDPYRIPGWPRAVTKAWIGQALGSGNPRPFQWSHRSREEFDAEVDGVSLQDAFAIREVGAAVTYRHPLLIDLRHCGLSTLDLQYHEAEILRLAMEDLMLKQDIPALPIHDALIVPGSRVDEATAALRAAFGTWVEMVTGSSSIVMPKVTCKAGK